MNLTERMRMCAIAQGFLANAQGALAEGNPEYADTCLSFVHTDVLKLRADIKVRDGTAFAPTTRPGFDAADHVVTPDPFDQAPGESGSAAG